MWPNIILKNIYWTIWINMYSIGCNVLKLLYTNGKLYFVFWCTIKGTLLVGKTFLTISFIVVMFSNAFCHLNLVSGEMSSHRVLSRCHGWGEACHTQTLVSFLKHIKLLLKLCFIAVLYNEAVIVGNTRYNIHSFTKMTH